MCQLCGCRQHLKEGKEAVLKRAMEIVQQLGITPQNVDDYEATETISHLIAPFGSTDEVYQTAVWVAQLHMGLSRLDREKHYQAHVLAFRDIFSRLPAQGEPRQIVTTWHQLEQLARELNEKDLAALDAPIRDTLQAVNHVHSDSESRVARLKQRYHL